MYSRSGGETFSCFVKTSTIIPCIHPIDAQAECKCLDFISTSIPLTGATDLCELLNSDNFPVPMTDI